MTGVNITLDSIKDISLFQARKGYRFSVDALLLEDFITVKNRSRVIELGTGSGIISLLLAQRLKNIKIVAVEIQRSLERCAEKNVKLNKLEDKIEIFHEDIKNLRKVFPPHTFDGVFSNPPFRKVRSGKLSIDRERAVARHEIEVALPDIIKTASYLLKDLGKFFLIYHPFRLIELITMLHTARLEPKRMRFVYARSGEEAKMVLVEAVKESGTWLTVEPPLYIHEQGNVYSEEMKRILESKVRKI
ncbi:tRNA1(Val) (adenine(37)-N6)-methyltransferase [bacterium]|nr:MAG: tRNA1(Val) (adenine(37)-N6)-methyltransferase [bacterium]